MYLVRDDERSVALGVLKGSVSCDILFNIFGGLKVLDLTSLNNFAHQPCASVAGGLFFSKQC
jgi:hypothetical protein